MLTERVLTLATLLLAVAMVAVAMVAPGEELSSEKANATLPVKKASVDFGENSFLHRNLSLFPCNGSNSDLVPYLLAAKKGSQSSSIKALVIDVNFGSAQAIIHIGSLLYNLSFDKEDSVLFFLHQYKTLPTRFSHQHRVEFKSSKTKSFTIAEIAGGLPLMTDVFHSYVIQKHVLEHGKPHERSTIIKELAGKIVQMSQQKFASNVVEKCLTFGGPDERELLVNEMLGTTVENEPLQAIEAYQNGNRVIQFFGEVMLAQDQSRNYDIQKILEACTDQQIIHENSTFPTSLKLQNHSFQRILGDEIASIASACRYCFFLFLSVISVTVVVTVGGIWYWLKDKTPTREKATIVCGIKVYEDKLIGKGVEGTLVFEGEFDKREVAVKRFQRRIFDIATDEIAYMKALDEHENMIRYYMMGSDEHFHYIALEKCSCNLSELILAFSHKVQNFDEEKKTALQKRIGCNDFRLSKPNHYPSLDVLNLIKDLIKGICHIHSRRMLQRVLNPENIMIKRMQETFSIKLSDMKLNGLLEESATVRAKGWSAPEVLTKAPTTRSADLFSLGCIIFYCISEGNHPFGDDELRVDGNVVDNNVDLSAVMNIPEAFDLIKSLIDPNPEFRPSFDKVLAHPFFWSSEQRLKFLREVGERISRNDTTASVLRQSLEGIKNNVLGPNNDWDVNASALLDGWKGYKGSKMKDLLRLIRNRVSHAGGMSKPNEQIIQGQCETFLEGLDEFIINNFRGLLMEVYKVILNHCATEDTFKLFF